MICWHECIWENDYNMKEECGNRIWLYVCLEECWETLRYYLWCYSILMGEILTFIFYILLEEFWVLLLLYYEKYVEAYFFSSYLHNNSNVILYCFIFFIAPLGSCSQWKTGDVTLFSNLFFYFNYHNRINENYFCFSIFVSTVCTQMITYIILRDFTL